MRTLPVALLAVMIPAAANADSLAEAARKEAERRKKIQKSGVKTRVYTDDTIAKAPKTDAPPPAPASVSESAAPVPVHDDSEERAQKEAYWRGRMAEAVERRDDAKAAYDELNELWLAPGESYVDENGNTVIKDVEHLRRLLADAKARWDAAERAIEDLQDEGRRAGALPGWFR